MFFGLTLLVSAFLLSPSVQAIKYRQPAYVVNAYFTNAITEQEGHPQPDRILNIARAGHAGSKGHFVLELLVDKGTHAVEVEMLDKFANKFNGYSFPRAEATHDNFPVHLVLNFDGRLPPGGVFFKVYDSLNNAPRLVIGTFRLFTKK